MADDTDRADHTILICSKCVGAGEAAAMRRALTESMPAGYRFGAVDCMAGCDHPTTVGFQAPGKATYLFGGIESQAELSAIAAFAHQYRESETGWTSASNRPAALYKKTLARLPALNRAMQS